MIPTPLTDEKKIIMMSQTKAVSNRSIDEPISCWAQSREGWRTHTASVPPADPQSDPLNLFAVHEVPKSLGISIESLQWGKTKISPLRLWTPPVHRTPVGKGQRSGQDSLKAGK